MNFFTSDTHFYHANIIKYARQQFTGGIDEMNEAMIVNWNYRVKPDDHIFHVGDFAFCNRLKCTELLGRLAGHKHLIVGNHDEAAKKAAGWDSVQDYKEMRDGQDFVVMAHYAFRVFNHSHHGSVQLYGHSHGSLPGNTQQIDVGVDCWGYSPCTLAEAKARMATLPPYRQEDRHTAELPDLT